MEEKVDRIKQYVVLLNSNIEQDKVFDFNVREMIDRILNYTNRNEVPVELERVLAKVIVNVYKKIENENNNEGEEQREINSISDNGQTISFSEKVKTYMISEADDKLFFGFMEQINRFVKAKVVGESEYSKQLQESNKQEFL